MMDDLAFNLAMGIAAVCGALTGRIFALEAQDRRTAVLAAAYCGAGGGLLGGPVLAFVLGLIARLVFAETGVLAALGDAAEATGPALLWGPAAGATGGLAVGVLVALCKRHAPR
jgi:hypothetical protein